MASKNADLKKEEALIAKNNQEISQLANKEEQLRQLLTDLGQQTEQRQKELQAFHQQREHAQETINRMLKDSPNLNFEVMSGRYKFDEMDPTKIEE